MTKQVCGGCNYHSEVRSSNGTQEVYCLFSQIWKKDNDSCKNWHEYVYRLSKEERLKLIQNKHVLEISKVDKFIYWCKNHPVLSVLIIIFLLLAALAGFKNTILDLLAK